MTGSILTFYSYKGGTGRSMAVANTAWILASNGLRVLAVDWDLEAPGLHRYVHPFLPDPDLRVSPGIIDLVWKFAEATMDVEAPDEPGWYDELARISPYAMSIEHSFPGDGTVDFVPAGRQDATYSALVSQFDWNNFYERLGGGGFLEALKRNMRDHYDYVLVDSRTGLSDTAGICTVQLPDILVNCFSLSNQAINGAEAVAASVYRQRRDGDLRIFPVPMRVEDGEQDKLDASRDYAQAVFGKYLTHLADPERYWGEVEVPYKSFYAYEEILATIGDRPRQENTVLAATERVVGYLTDGQVTTLAAVPSEPDRRALLTRFQRTRPKDRTTGAGSLSPARGSGVFRSYTHESAPATPRSTGPSRSPMTRIFLSYAEEDQIVGQGLARALVDRGFTVYWWQDSSRPGGRFQDDIEQEIYDAGRFVAVLSDNYLRSPWCRRERNMAVQLEVVEERRDFIAVFEVGTVHQEWPGWLSEYARIPVRGTDWSAAVDAYVTAIGDQPGHAAIPAIRMSTGPRPKFRDRVDELNLIVDELTSEGGIDVWLVSAPPQLGKSWFLDEVADRVRRQVPDCQVRMLDVKAERSVLRGDPVMLLKTMFDISSPLPESVAELRWSALNKVAMELSRRRQPQLYMLDSADLLEGRSLEWLRRTLDEVFRRLSTAGTRTRVRVIISGRQVDKWPFMSTVRSRKLRLAEFSEGVVRAALSDLAGQSHDLGTERFDALTRRLHRFCEGLPALLVEALDRVVDHDFIGIDDDEWWQEAFAQVVRPYVADHLLSTDSLFQAGGQDLDHSKALIELGLKALAPYRMVTKSHLAFHIDRDVELRAALGRSSWGPSSLLKALYETALVVPVLGKPWHEIYPPIRRLLYRYYVTDDQNRETVQRVAQQYYQSFSERLTGTEQLQTLIEYIWHEVVRRSTGVFAERLDDLPEFAANATQEFVRDSIYNPFELDQFTSQLLADDLELRRALSTQVGLFEELLGSIQSAIG